MRAPASSCLWCGPAPVEPVRERKRRDSVTGWYKCACGRRWLVCWLASTLGEASAA